MTRACANKGGQPAPYTRYQKKPFDYTSVYRRNPHLRHWKHNPITCGFAVGAVAARGAVRAELAARTDR